MPTVSVPDIRTFVLHVSSRSGRLRVIAEERDDVSHDGHAEVGGGRINIKATKGSAPLEVRCPAGFDVMAGSGSGTVELMGRFGCVRVTTGNGAINIEEAAEADLRTASGLIQVGRCGSCRAATASGDIRVAKVTRARLATVSGSVAVGQADGPIDARAVSGKVTVGLGGAHDLDLRSISGTVHVDVPDDVRPRISLKSISGRRNCRCPEGSDCDVEIRTVSGGIELVPRS